MPLDERVALAAGRRPERVLMAAMAQTDCGQCGYLCKTYAEAIASGVETSLSRCVPGGKATSRKLKALVAELGMPGEERPERRGDLFERGDKPVSASEFRLRVG